MFSSNALAAPDWDEMDAREEFSRDAIFCPCGLRTVGGFDLSWNNWRLDLSWNSLKEQERGSFRKANNGVTADLRFLASSIGGTFCHHQIPDPFSCSEREEEGN